MELRRLGASDLDVSEISLGSWLTYGGGVANERARACVEKAFEVGINFIDTANVYAHGRAEEFLGDVLQGRERSSYVLATKLYFPMPGGDRGLSRAQVEKQIEASLRRLRTDYVDLYQCYRYDYDTPLEETMQAFADVVRAGKALYIGVSEWRADQIRAGKALADRLGVPLVSNQPQYSAIYRVIEAEVIPTCRELGLGQIVFSPLAQGVLTGKYRPGQPPPEGSRATDEAGGGAGFIERLLRDELLEAVQQLRPLADEAGLSMAGLALAWVLQEDNVASAIIGASRPEQVRDIVKAVGVRLDPELRRRVDELLLPVSETDPGLTQSPNPRA